MSSSRLLCVWIVCALTAGCGDGTGPADEPGVVSVSVTPAHDTLLVGSTVQLSAQAKDASGVVLSGIEFMWSSTDSAVATVTPQGVASAISPGGMFIRATAEGKFGFAALTVWPVVSSVQIDPPPDSVLYGATVQLFATALDRDGNPFPDSSIQWVSADTRLILAVTGPDVHPLVRRFPNGVFLATDTGTVDVVAVAYALRDTVQVSIRFPSPLAFTSVTTSQFAGNARSCGTVANGQAYCWGISGNGELGNGWGFPAKGAVLPRPVPVLGSVQFSVVEEGGLLHSCGRDVGGKAYCWGSNTSGQLGLGNDSTGYRVPRAVVGDLSFADLSLGQDHVCGVTFGGDVYCWGNNEQGQLGVTSTLCRFGSQCRKEPARVEGGIVLASVSAGAFHTCGIDANGAAYCWGGGDDGRLGQGAFVSSDTVVRVAGGLAFNSLSGGGLHTCGLATDGQTYCWGLGATGQLGGGGTSSSAEPQLVTGGLSFTAISAGVFHTCGLLADGTAYCWGLAEDGRLGAAGFESCTFFGIGVECTQSPVAVSGGVRFASLEAGGRHNCGLGTDGVAYCWGSNELGQLGDGTREDRGTPVPVLNQQ